MLARLVSILPLAGLLLIALDKSYAEPKDLAVIVSKTSGVLALSSRDLRSMFLGEKDRWPDGTKVVAVSLPSEHPETRMVLKAICGMSESDFKRYFLMMSFQGKEVSPPRMAPTSGAVRAFVRSTPGAVGVIRFSDVDGSVSVVSIDGAVPGAPGYKLAMAK